MRAFVKLKRRDIVGLDTDGLVVPIAREIRFGSERFWITFEDLPLMGIAMCVCDSLEVEESVRLK